MRSVEIRSGAISNDANTPIEHLLTNIGRRRRLRRVTSLSYQRSPSHPISSQRVCRCTIKPKFHGSSFLVASSRTRPTRATSSYNLLRRCYEDVARVGRLPVQLATRLPDWSAGGLLRCSVVRLSVCRCRSPTATSTSTTRTTCCRYVSDTPCHLGMSK